MEMERNFTESLGTRVRIEKGKEGGKVTIDFFSPDDLRALLERLNGAEKINATIANQVPVVAENSAPIDDRAPADIKEAEESDDLYSLKDFSL